MARKVQQRVVTLALEVLDSAAYRSATERVDTAEVRFALAVLVLFVRDRSGLVAFWERAQKERCHPWDTCRDPYYQIAHALRAQGWHAPVG